MSRGTVAEIQGEYGPLRVSELLIQKIWLRQDFDTEGLHTLEGAPLGIVAPGRWNRLEGPDFRDAKLQIAGTPVSGDVEIHFYARDWKAHGHDRDSLYKDVKLHVVVFRPLPSETETFTKSGRQVPVLVLLPLLKRDLETCAMAEALRAEGGDDPLDIAARLLERPLTERLQLVRDRARQRWGRKVRHALCLLDELGWENALHRGMLEVLGYARNREPMRRIAVEWPLSRMVAEKPEPRQLFDSQEKLWRLNGIRPANRPITRLEQYLGLLQERPDWPARLMALAQELPEQEFDGASPTNRVRKALGFSDLERRMGEGILSNSVGGTRLNTLVCDLFLPMLAAREAREAKMTLEEASTALPDRFPLWYHWRVGDLPDGIGQILRLAELTDKQRPACNGLYQGGLQLCLEGLEALTGADSGDAEPGD